MTRLTLADQVLLFVLVEGLHGGGRAERPIGDVANVLCVACLRENLHFVFIVEITNVKIGTLCCGSELNEKFSCQNLKEI